MIVTQEQYENMKETIMVNISEGRKIKASECDNMGFDIEAVTSLHSQILVRLRKIDFKKADVNVIKTVLVKLRGFQKENNNNSNNVNSDINSNSNEESRSNHRKKSFVNFSNELGVSSYRTAKIIIENLLGKNVSVSQVIEDPMLILDESVRRNVLECVMNDPLCSLESDQLKECTGKEFEALLLQQLQVTGYRISIPCIAFQTCLVSD
jgi:hypothetical protein